jgi:transposase
MKNQVVEFEQIIDRGCGIDVHKKEITVTIGGVGIKTQTRTFNTFTSSLIELSNWLTTKGITHIAMESTGVYWKPIYNILEGDFEILLVNARHVKNVPGHKTDKKDSSWLCKLLLAGLLKGSFIPPREIRELRDLTRYKSKLKAQITSEKNRTQKILEDANLKLSSVVSDVFGVSSISMIDELLEGENDPDKLVTLAKGNLRNKRAELKEALICRLSEHHKFMIKTIRNNISRIQDTIKEIDEAITEKVKAYKTEIELLDTIPGVDRDGAIGVIAEVGVDMEVFPNEQHLASWAGISPGNNETAGKKKAVG